MRKHSSRHVFPGAGSGGDPNSTKVQAEFFNPATGTWLPAPATMVPDAD